MYYVHVFTVYRIEKHKVLMKYIPREIKMVEWQFDVEATDCILQICIFTELILFRLFGGFRAEFY